MLTHQSEGSLRDADDNKDDVIIFAQGGTLIEYEGKQRLLEIAQVPKEHVSFCQLKIRK